MTSAERAAQVALYVAQVAEHKQRTGHDAFRFCSPVQSTSEFRGCPTCIALSMARKWLDEIKDTIGAPSTP